MSSTASQLKRLADCLETYRQQHKTVTYLELADALDIPAPQRIHKISVLLEALMEHDQAHQLAPRAALVVSRVPPHLPADGFFLKARALGLMPDISSEAFHRHCLQKLFNQCGL